MKTNFQIGDRVYDIVWGWGVVTGTNRRIEVKFDSGIYQTFTKDGRYSEDSKPTLSFTEYTLKGFSQERPIILPEVGELCLVRDTDSETWKVRNFMKYKNELFFTQSSEMYCEASWKQMKRIKILD